MVFSSITKQKNKKVNKKLIIAIVLIAAIALLVYGRKKKQETKTEEIDFNYEGDNYEGSLYYVGDKNFYNNDKGRKFANAVPSSLYKVVEPAYKLKYEYNDKGNKTLIRVSSLDKPDLKRGDQLRIITDSEQSPLVVMGNKFVQTIYGNFVRFDKIKKIRD